MCPPTFSTETMIQSEPVFFFPTEKTRAEEVQEKVREAICENFCYIRYSGSQDTAQTVRAIRAHNAALSVYKCSTLNLDRLC